MEFRSCARGASVVWHHSFLLMNGFNKTEDAVFSCRLSFLRAFPSISLIELVNARIQNLFHVSSPESKVTTIHVTLVFIYLDSSDLAVRFRSFYVCFVNETKSLSYKLYDILSNVLDTLF